MKREELENYVKTYIRNEFEHIETKILLEKDDIIFFEVKEHNKEKYIHSRKVFIVAIRLSIKREDNWFTFAPSKSQYKALSKNFNELFKQTWNSNIENAFNQL